jgi:multiple sugar transport system ATP-binding protein
MPDRAGVNTMFAPRPAGRRRVASSRSLVVSACYSKGYAVSIIEFNNIRKVFGAVVALEEFSLTIPSPTLVVLVGPSGCGKTTLLRLLAGLERPTSGAIMLGDERLDTLEARKRDVAMVFQNYALFPHMTVRENLSFGLTIRKVPKARIAQRVAEVAESLEIGQLLARRPAELSGGQRQRVALGRAVIREPRVFLFDEPLSNLDARLRDEMRYLIKKLYQRLRTTMVFVTHDQVEAMTMGEILVVMRDGRIHQVGTPEECYGRPRDTFVASFLGSPPMNLVAASYNQGQRSLRAAEHAEWHLPGHVAERVERSGARDVIVGVRPEHFDPDPDTRNGFRLSGKVVLEETLGHEILTHIDVNGEEIVVRGRRRLNDGGDGRVSVWAPVESLHFFSKDTGARIDAASGDTASA